MCNQTSVLIILLVKSLNLSEAVGQTYKWNRDCVVRSAFKHVQALYMRWNINSVQWVSINTHSSFGIRTFILGSFIKTSKLHPALPPFTLNGSTEGEVIVQCHKISNKEEIWIAVPWLLFQWYFCHLTIWQQVRSTWHRYFRDWSFLLCEFLQR